jgi:hypothetical protein
MGQMMMCVYSTCLIIIYIYFLEIIYNEKLEESDGGYDDM